MIELINLSNNIVIKCQNITLNVGEVYGRLLDREGTMATLHGCN